MTPVLFYPTAEVFDHSDASVGNLTDCASCIVTEERNGMFDLQMEYPVGGIFWKEIEPRRIILAKPNPKDQAQPFRIVRISRQMDGIISVYAQHVAYDLVGIPARPIPIVTNAKDVFPALYSAIIGNNPFRFEMGLGVNAVFYTNGTLPVWTILGNEEGMILDVFGGEYQFDRFTVRLLYSRGEDRGAVIKYGKNLIDLVKDEDVSEIYTGIVPFYYKNSSTTYLPEFIVSAEGAHSFERLLPVDLTNEFNDVPTENQLRNAAQKYVKRNIKTTPIINLDINYFHDVIDAPVHLCDLVTVEYPEFGISGKYQCYITEYDTLAERYTRIGIGERAPSVLEKLWGRIRTPWSWE